MITSKLIRENFNTPIKSFPKLMISANLHVIVLFSAKERGTVVYVKPECNLYHTGYYATSWTPEEFVDYNDEIVLKNK